MTGFNPNQLQEAFKKGDNEILDKAFDEELKKKKGNLSKQIFKNRDLLDYINQAIKHAKYGVIKYIPLKKYSNHRKVTVYMNIN